MGINIGGECLYNLLFAIFRANFDEVIEYMTGKLMQGYSKWGFNVNINKIDHLVVERLLLNIQIENEVFKKCKEYKYLESYIRGK